MASTALSYLQKEDVCTLHARVEDLGSSQIVCFRSSHDLTTLSDSSKGVESGNVHDQCPVLIWLLVDLFRSTQELDPAHIHANSLPDLYHVLQTA